MHFIERINPQREGNYLNTMHNVRGKIVYCNRPTQPADDALICATETLGNNSSPWGFALE